ncbi:MAG: hypothetical protein Q9164_001051 [Protoblastenia rupestris]
MASPPPTPIQIHIPPTLQKHAIPLTSFLQTNPQYTNLAVGAFIFHPPLSALFPSSPTSSATSTTTPHEQPRLLILQRAASESAFPNLWEVPGGSSEVTDPTILHSVARETFEETGLRLTRFVREVGERVEFGSGRKRWVKLGFEIDFAEMGVCGGGGGDDDEEILPGSGVRLISNEGIGISLDPDEHQDYRWATEEEIRAMAGEMVTQEQFEIMMKAFVLRKADMGGLGNAHAED